MPASSGLTVARSSHTIESSCSRATDVSQDGPLAGKLHEYSVERTGSVAVTQHANPSKVARYFADLIAQNGAVRVLLVREGRSVVELWLVTDPIDRDCELTLYGAIGPLEDQFPDAEIELHLLNAAHFTINPLEVVPAGAEPVYTR